MRIQEIITESSHEDLKVAIDDLLSLAMSKDIHTISVPKFLNVLGKRGYVISPEELVDAAGGSMMVASIDTSTIQTSDATTDDTGEQEAPADVGGMADAQAMKDIKADL